MVCFGFKQSQHMKEQIEKLTAEIEQLKAQHVSSTGRGVYAIGKKIRLKEQELAILKEADNGEIQLTLNTCTVRDFTGDCPRTLSKSDIAISPNIKWPYTWVQIDPSEEHGSEIFCIFINDEWHQAQSIDFNF